MLQQSAAKARSHLDYINRHNITKASGSLGWERSYVDLLDAYILGTRVFSRVTRSTLYSKMDVNPARSPTQASDKYSDQSSCDSPSPVKKGVLLEPPARPLASAKGYKVWLKVTWPLLLHGVLTIFTFALMLLYVNGHNFNISERRPTARLNDGTTVSWTYYTPLQSDITTFLSVSIAIIRLAAAGWAGSLCWRCAFILMEAIGLTPKRLQHLISYNITSMPFRGAAKRTQVICSLIWVTLALTIPSHLSAPILTGSITWVPGHHHPQLLSNSTIPTTLYNGEVMLWDTEGYNDFWKPVADQTFLRLSAASRAQSYNEFAWGREKRIDSFRRYVPGLLLEVNSTLTNITLPYLSVHSVEWIDDPNSTLGIGQPDIRNIFCPPIANTTYVYCPIITGLALFPNFDWYSQTNEWPPPPIVIADKWLLAMYVGNFTGNTNHPSGCTFRSGRELNSETTELSDAVFVDVHNWCYMFAWVDFTAGVATCRDCLVVSQGTVQNTTSLSVKEDHLTNDALRLMLDTSALIESSELPESAPVWDNIDDYVAGMLSRAYAATWTSTNEVWAHSIPTRYSTTYSISAPSSQASVSTLRVYIWLGLQFLVTLSGIVFIYIQSRTDTAIIVDNTLAAFYLNTRAVYERGECAEAPVMRRVEFEGNRLRLQAERVEPNV